MREFFWRMSCRFLERGPGLDAPGGELLLQLRYLRLGEGPRGRRTRRAAILAHQPQRGLHDRHVGAALLFGPQVLESRHDVDEFPGQPIVALLERGMDRYGMLGPHVDEAGREAARSDREKRRRPRLREAVDPDDVRVAAPDRFGEAQRRRR